MKLLIISDQAFELALMVPAFAQDGVSLITSTGKSTEVLSLFEIHKPNVVVIDIRFNQQHAIALCHELRAINPLIGLIILADCPDLRMLGITMGSIPVGSQIILKTVPDVINLVNQAIPASVLAAKSKETFIWAGANDIVNAPQFLSILSGLTDIQIETMRLVGRGLSNAEISRVRFVTEKSVEQIVTKISHYFDVGSSSSKNRRVLLTGEYFKWIGAPRK
jgi:DNA-binding NarL/FixJ family response regulator